MKVKVGTEWTHYSENNGWIGKSFKGLKHHTVWNFEEINKQTKFTFTQEYSLPWYMGGIVFDKLMMIPQWKQIIFKSLENLKNQTE